MTKDGNALTSGTSAYILITIFLGNNMSPEQLLEYASYLKTEPDPFSQWASNHIICELEDFFTQNPEYGHKEDFLYDKLYHTEEEPDYYLDFDGYWLMLCENDKELSDLLHSWYNIYKH